VRTEQAKSSERSRLISKLLSDFGTRVAYIQSKVSTLVPSQIRALRLKSDMPRQKDLADAAELHQSRISMFETAGANPTVETLSVIAAALRVGLKIEFVPFSEMLEWENNFSQDQFNVIKLEKDERFLNPAPAFGYHVSQSFASQISAFMLRLPTAEPMGTEPTGGYTVKPEIPAVDLINAGVPGLEIVLPKSQFAMIIGGITSPEAKQMQQYTNIKPMLQMEGYNA